MKNCLLISKLIQTYANDATN